MRPAIDGPGDAASGAGSSKPARVMMIAGSEPPRVIAAGPLDCGERERFSINGRAYCLNPTELTFFEAEDACQAMRGHLVTIGTSDEQEALRAHFAPAWTPQGTLWIGLVEPFREGDWRWVTGEPARFLAFRSGEPNDVGGEDCGEWNATDGAWNDLNCFVTRPYICESPAAVGKKGAAGSPLACTGDGQRFTAGSKDLCAHTRSLTFGDAQEACRKAGGSLAVIRSALENSEMQKAFGPKIGPVGAMWIGIADQEQEGRFAWTSGEAADFTSWISGEPNNSGSNEDCGTWVTAVGDWNDVPCASRLRSLCEGSL